MTDDIKQFNRRWLIINIWDYFRITVAMLGLIGAIVGFLTGLN